MFGNRRSPHNEPDLLSVFHLPSPAKIFGDIGAGPGNILLSYFWVVIAKVYEQVDLP